MEIQVGEYIRTKKYICKVTKIMEQDEELPLYYCTDLDFGFLEKDIVKHSFNIIDLIEEGDYVNGYKVIDVINGECCPSGKCVDIDSDLPSNECTLWEDDIKSIVTKEQFESIKYEV